MHKKCLARYCNWGIRLPKLFLKIFSYVNLVISDLIHHNPDGSGSESLLIIFCTSFVANDLYNNNSSAIELEFFGFDDTRYFNVASVDTELRNEVNGDFVIDWLFGDDEDSACA